jgi:hypothetical protein
LQVDYPGLTVEQLSDAGQRTYDRLMRAVYDLFTSPAPDAATEPLAATVTEFLNLSEYLDPESAFSDDRDKWLEQRRTEFLRWARPFASNTQYLCWVRGKPGDVVNLSASYTTADVRDELEGRDSGLRAHDGEDVGRRQSGLRRALCGETKDARRRGRLAIYRGMGVAPLHNVFRVPGKERGASYYFTQAPPDNTKLAYFDWQEGNSLDRGDNRLDSANPAVHFHIADDAAPDHTDPKTIRAYVRSSPRAHKQIAAAALLNLVFIYLVARGRIGDASSAADWLLLAPSVLLAYIADQQRHYYAMATRRQRGVLWVYLGIAIGALVTAVFGSPRSSAHWGWLATTLAWLLVGSSVLLFLVMVPLGDRYETVTKKHTLKREGELRRRAENNRADPEAVDRWRCYEWVTRRYSDRIAGSAFLLTALVVTVLAITNWGRTLPTWLGGVPKTSAKASSTQMSSVAAEAVSAMVVPWSVLLRTALSAPPAHPPRSDRDAARGRKRRSHSVR